MSSGGSYGIRFTRGCLAGESQLLQEGDTSIGRSDCNDVTIRDIMVSRRHARFTVRGATLVIEDQESKAGTFVNGQRISGQVQLKLGDRIELGNQELEVVSVKSLLNRENDLGRPGVLHSEGDSDEGFCWNNPREVKHCPKTAHGRECAAGIAIAITALAAILLFLNLFGGASRSQDRPAVGLVPDGWVVDSRFVDVLDDGTTNEVVLVLKPGG